MQSCTLYAARSFSKFFIWEDLKSHDLWIFSTKSVPENLRILSRMLWLIALFKTTRMPDCIHNSYSLFPGPILQLVITYAVWSLPPRETLHKLEILNLDKVISKAALTHKTIWYFQFRRNSCVDYNVIEYSWHRIKGIDERLPHSTDILTPRDGR